MIRPRRQRFEREVLLAREVSHPNLCPIYDIFHCEQPPANFLFLTMKLLPGETLAARLRRTAPIPIAEGMAILKQMAAGLAAIHCAGIIHRDIKPNNIMLDGTGSDVRLYITDFGLARAHEAEPSLSSKGLIAGTPDYMAPELYLGQAALASQRSFRLWCCSAPGIYWAEAGCVAGRLLCRRQSAVERFRCAAILHPAYRRMPRSRSEAKVPGFRARFGLHFISTTAREHSVDTPSFCRRGRCGALAPHCRRRLVEMG